MLATAISAALHGIEAKLVRIETDISGGFPRFTMLGLPNSCVKESEGRIRARSATVTIHSNLPPSAGVHLSSPREEINDLQRLTLT